MNVYEFTAVLEFDKPEPAAYAERHYTQRVLAPCVETALQAFVASVPTKRELKRFQSGEFVYDRHVQVVGYRVTTCKTCVPGVGIVCPQAKHPGESA